MMLAPFLSLSLVIAAFNVKMDSRGEISLLYLALLVECIGTVSGFWLLFGRWSTLGVRGLAFSCVLINVVAVYLAVFFLRR